jgi:ribosomal protein L11 methyltransferase
MKYPALDVRGTDSDVVLAVVDDFAPTAVEELDGGISIYFSTASARDSARAAVGAALPAADTSMRDVDDEDWAKRSQANLTSVTVGCITVRPPWFADAPALGPPTAEHVSTITILPSMGFGTGHHATTRLCLAALQQLDVRGARVLDVGTGSGVLAIAAGALGAQEALGIDVDPDAVSNALENLALNPSIQGVQFKVADMRHTALPPADIALANLTGAVLVQNARLLSSAVAPGGTLVVSGLMLHERAEVLDAFAGATVQWSGDESEWGAIAFNFPSIRGV